ncbi:MAG: hypothetical protein GY813_12210, partial [Halieaceae bacterium]|nr:hypothetical protein [Halieaceae bacterium]
HGSERSIRGELDSDAGDFNMPNELDSEAGENCWLAPTLQLGRASSRSDGAGLANRVAFRERHEAA